MTESLIDFRLTCIEACNDCHLACEVCAEATMSLRVLEDVVRACRDCGEVTRATASFLARESPLSVEMLSLCMTACERCAGICEATDLAHCLLCAQACRLCEAECRQVTLDVALAAA